MNYLADKTIVLGVSAGAAIYKSLEFIRLLVKNGVKVYPILTENAAKMVSRELFLAISGESVGDGMAHISLKKADLVCILPATANIISKIAYGLADDLLSTTVLASEAPLMVVPAMNDAMWRKPVIVENVEKLRSRGVTLCGPVYGGLACGDEGLGRMAPLDMVFAYMERIFAPKNLCGRKVLITAGPTVEMWDSVRCITNLSSGKTGYSLAKEAWLRGAVVTLVSGPVSLEKPYDMEVANVVSADEMFEAVKARFSECSHFVSCAAVCDFKPQKIFGKIKKSYGLPDMKLLPTPDILRWAGENKKGQTVIGFALEDSDVEVNAKAKMVEKNCDFMVANHVSNIGAEAGFATVFSKNGLKVPVSGNKSHELASSIWDAVMV